MPIAGISSALLTNFTFLSQYSAASTCSGNFNSTSVGNPVHCGEESCPLVSAADTEILHGFSEIGPGDTAGYDFWKATVAVGQVLKRPVRKAKAIYPDYGLTVTGHSLGGALATLYAIFLRNEGYNEDFVSSRHVSPCKATVGHTDLSLWYSFGAPSIGNFAFAEFITNTSSSDSGRNYCITHLSDEMPKVLYRTSRMPALNRVVAEYSQSAPEYWITSAYEEPVTTADIQVLEGVDNDLGNNMVNHQPSWIDGQQAPPTATTIPVINPATEETLATIDATSSEAVNEIITTSCKTFHSGVWSKKDPSDRFTVLSQASTLLRSRINDFIALETAQTGRPIREMRTQLARVPEWLDYFASLARVHEGRVTPFKGAVINTLTRIPLGVVVLITPYNHPLLIAMKKIAAALAAGNVVIVKPSELAPLSVLKLGALFKEAGLPDGVLQIVSGYGRETGKYLCEHPKISKIDLTGGIATYKAIAPVAAANMVPITAELGGKAPVCLFPSMDIETAVKAALFAGFIASGQTCVTGSRLLVHQDIYEDFKTLLEKRVRALRVGDPTDEKTQIGSVISSAAIDRCESFVSRATAEGGRILCGGTRLSPTPQGTGFFFAPTIIETETTSDLASNEVFGPVLALIKCADEDEIVAIANSTSYALGASVWSNDFTQAHRVADRIEAGIVWINGHHLNDPSSPWGGFKESGLGKENGAEAFESYTKVKSTVMNYGVKPVWFDDEVVGARYG
ncbi:hypothetical protein BDW74DRAFT_189934 [Aspergillus multicolor]|uniref:uncharacterized protein n=1 Tax=Aspergillus multicolor TaxID=41759 RepID=UPI003CCDDAFF